MGTTVQTFKLPAKIKTMEQVRAWYADAAEQSRYESGHSYSGEIGCTNRIYFTGRDVELLDDLEEVFVEKGDVAVFRVKVFNEQMATLVKWGAKLNEAYQPVWGLQVQLARDPKNKEVQRALKAQHKAVERARARLNELRRNAAARSSKYQYAVVAACPS